MTIYIVLGEALRGFTHPGLDLQTGQLVELEAEPVPVQLELFPLDLNAGLSPEPRHGYLALGLHHR